MGIQIKGIRNTLDVLKDLDNDLRLDVLKVLKGQADRLRNEARGMVDPDGLSGWGGWRGGYNPGTIRGGIKTTTAKRRARGGIIVNVAGVENTTAAGVIWELAGRKTNGAPPRPGINPKTGWTYGNGVGFVNNIRSKSGRRASRLVWGAYDSPEDFNISNARTTIEAVAFHAAKVAQDKLGAGLG